MEPCGLEKQVQCLWGPSCAGWGDIDRGHVAASLWLVIGANDHNGAATYSIS